MRPIMLIGQERPLTQVKYNREGDLLFTCAKDGSASVWYSINGERLGTFEGHAGVVWSIDVDKESMYCVTGSADFTIKLWKCKNGENIQTWNTDVPVKRVEFSPCGNYIVAVMDNVMGYKGSLDIFEIRRDPKTNEIIEIKDKPIKIIETPEGMNGPTVAGWSTNGKFIIAGHKDGHISKYDCSKDYEFVDSMKLHKQNVTDIQFSQDLTYFITSSRDSTAILVDVATLKKLKTFECDCPLNSACITPVKEFVILGGGQDAKDVTTTSASEGKFEARIYHKIFEEEIGRVPGHFGPLNCVAVSPTGTSYASGGEEGIIRVHHFEKSYFDFQYEVEKAAEAKEHMQEA
ncbi:hypothetical protein TBLA_0B09190 [Henningerozyma blattae CBS 6284]|uniref:Eukaryotic translation initiation factor 3 subunit I n=1 Tax=Henningerozyma blattae (strain ATCC 34711 / CBS 6284 / DSM 70876 / NBRC 10599 / NRRL Y-10934 / UCD 77-7) TaxID=1071380 RepID=I2H032_HENB6|nr:hypothetical protein TBLA_0B09190 [Tetrapisispora blattae CBS 6284]CCH59734.1 hypothetical protein TBLA_0B09190 [Tetrapisispora blattae CBS 6284]